MNTQNNRLKMISLCGLVLLMAMHINTDSCTCGAVHCTASFDGRGIAWKNRDISGVTQKIFFKRGPVYDYLAVGGTDTRMGLNTQGLAMGHSIVEDLGVPFINNVKNHDYILGNLCSLSQCTTVFGNQTRGFAKYYDGNTSMTTPIVDAFGNSIYVEVGHVSYVVNEYGDSVPPFFCYNPLDYGPDKARKQPVVVRTNYTHKNSSGNDDSSSTDKRFIDGRTNLQNAVTREGISLTDPLGGSGVTIGELIQVSRFGNPGTGAYRTTCGLQTRCAMLAHTVNAGEDPRIAVMWVALGNPDYTPFIPVWVENGIQGDLLSTQTTYITDSLHHFIDYASILYNRRDSSNYDKYVNERFEPMESNFIDITYEARERWFRSGFVYAEAKNIYVNSANTAWNTIRTIALQAAVSKRPLNSTPLISNIEANLQSKTVTLSHNGSDPDGTIANTFWDFGDGNSSSEANPAHTYEAAGTYLVMCRVTDNNGSSNARWKYIDVLPSASEGLSGEYVRGMTINPNPFNSSTVIAFNTTISNIDNRKKSRTLKIFDTNSRLVRSVYPKAIVNANTAKYEYVLSANDLPSGVYYAAVKIGSVQHSRKFVLQR